MKCPVCRATYRASEPKENLRPDDRHSIPKLYHCHRCGVDLSPLISLYDQAIWHYRQAIQFFKAGDYAVATAQNNQALALQSTNADFHALAGQLWALQGEFRQAIAAWEKAQQLNPQHPTASACLQCLSAMFGVAE
jgi:tetratricopeptide (TPR) repeat protein